MILQKGQQRGLRRGANGKVGAEDPAEGFVQRSQRKGLCKDEPTEGFVQRSQRKGLCQGASGSVCAKEPAEGFVLRAQQNCTEGQRKGADVQTEKICAEGPAKGFVQKSQRKGL